VNVGELISLHASINHVGKSSMVIGIKVTSLDVKKGVEKHTNTSYFNMVAKDENGIPCLVPPLIIEKEEELRRCIEAIKRKNLKHQNKEHFNNENARLNLANDRHLLNGERIQSLV
jgi:acyl-CoA hydrolase